MSHTTAAASAVAGMAARFAAGNDALGNLVCAREAALQRWRSLDQAITAAASKPPDKRDLDAEARARSAFEDVGACLLVMA